MKIFIPPPRENWICERFLKEWKQYLSKYFTEDPREADIIWILAGWQWQSIPRELLSNKKVVVTVHHHLNDCKKYEKMNLPGVKFIYIGHCANKRIFKNYNLKKKYDISFVGIDNPSIYPVRHRLKQISLQLSNIYNVHFHPHPGYNLPDAYKDLYLIDMAKVINQSKIIISCSSKFKYRLGKYIEVPMSHSVLCADIPNDSDNYNYLIDFHNDMSDQEIMKIISYYLNNSDALTDKQLKGLEFAMNYTQDHYAERLLNEIVDFI